MKKVISIAVILITACGLRSGSRSHFSSSNATGEGVYGVVLFPNGVDPVDNALVYVVQSSGLKLTASQTPRPKSMLSDEGCGEPAEKAIAQ